MKRRIVPFLAIAVIALTSGCSYARRIERRSDVMAYLYPHATTAPEPKPDAVRLELPLRVGIAFVPPTAGTGCRICAYTRSVAPDQEKALLDIVRTTFEERDWVRQVVLIPSAYLRPGGGFTNLRQVARMHGVDVIALVSIDQLQSSHPHKLSFLYLTVIGAYVLPLDEHETRTLIDAAVFHVPTETFLLRAPGHSSVEGHAATVDLEADLAKRAATGLRRAMDDLSLNLSAEVDRFKEEVAAGRRADVEIVTADGKSIRRGSPNFGGAFGGVDALASLLLALGAAVARRRR